MREERTITASAKRIADELGLVKSRSVWRTWLSSPQLSGSLPHGSKDHGVAARQYASITPGAFTSYLTPAEQQELLQKFANPPRGRRNHGPEHPTRGRVLCGFCGKPLQRRLDHNRKPRWLTCHNIHCEVGRRSISLPDTTEVLIRAVFHFGRLDLEKRVLNYQQARKNAPISPREAELEATITTLQAMDASIVGGALEKAERELAGLRQNIQTSATLDTINSAKVLELMEFSAGFALQDQEDPAVWQQLADLVKLVPVTLTTKQHDTKTFGGKRVVVLDRAYFRRGTELEESIPVEQLPSFGTKGSRMKISELALAVRSMSL